MVWVGFVAAGSTTLAQAATQYALTLLPPLSAGVSNATAINNLGVIVGQSTTAVDGFHATRWLASAPTTPFDLGTLGRGNSIANAVSQSGVPAGKSATIGGLDHPFVGSGSSLFDLESNLFVPGVAYGVNDSGQTVGQRILGGAAATVWIGASQTPITLRGARQSVAYGINDAGQIVGQSGVSPDVPAIDKPVMWASSTADPIDLSNSANASGAARAINEAGDIAGAIGASAVLWIAQGPTLLGQLGTSASANALNNAHDVVGVSFVGGSPRATIWLNAGSPIDLNSFLPASIVSAGWTLEFANGINDSGLIVGNAYNPTTGDRRGFLLTPTLAASLCPVNARLTIERAVAMQIQVTSPTSDPLLTYAQNTCGFRSINFVQKMVVLPLGTNIIPNIPFGLTNSVTPPLCESTLPNAWPAAHCQLKAPATLFDPPSGGYTYADDRLGHHYDPYPFTLPLTWLDNNVIGGCTVFDQQGNRLCPPNPPFVSSDRRTVSFVDIPQSTAFSGETPTSNPSQTSKYIAFVTTVVGVSVSPTAGASLCGPGTSYYCTNLFSWSWNSTYTGSAGGASRTAPMYPMGAGPLGPGGSGGVSITSINGVQLPALIPATSLALTSSGLAYSRASRTFNGTITIRNLSSSSIAGPLQVLMLGMPPGVTLDNATKDLSGTPYITAPSLTALAAGASVTLSVRFKNPLSEAINLVPTVYSGEIH